MPVKGIGTDIIEVVRIQKSIERHSGFLKRLFTKNEQDYCEKHKKPFLRYAGRFAAKEAIVKALGTGMGKEVSWHDIEILCDSKGKPHVIFSEKIKKSFHNPLVLISISHSDSYAIAYALWEI